MSDKSVHEEECQRSVSGLIKSFEEQTKLRTSAEYTNDRKPLVRKRNKNPSIKLSRKKAVKGIRTNLFRGNSDPTDNSLQRKLIGRKERRSHSAHFSRDVIEKMGYNTQEQRESEMKDGTCSFTSIILRHPPVEGIKHDKISDDLYEQNLNKIFRDESWDLKNLAVNTAPDISKERSAAMEAMNSLANIMKCDPEFDFDDEKFLSDEESWQDYELDSRTPNRQPSIHLDKLLSKNEVFGHDNYYIVDTIEEDLRTCNSIDSADTLINNLTGLKIDETAEGSHNNSCEEINSDEQLTVFLEVEGDPVLKSPDLKVCDEPIADNVNATVTATRTLSLGDRQVTIEYLEIEDNNSNPAFKPNKTFIDQLSQDLGVQKPSEVKRKPSFTQSLRQRLSSHSFESTLLEQKQLQKKTVKVERSSSQFYLSLDHSETQPEVESSDTESEDYVIRQPTIQRSNSTFYVPLDKELEAIRDSVFIKRSEEFPEINNNVTQRPKTIKDLKYYIVKELIDTEETYIQCLRYVINEYWKPISAKLKATGRSTKKKNAGLLFSNMDEICFQARVFCEDLKKNRDDYNNIGNVFMRHEVVLFQLYPKYFQKYTKYAVPYSNHEYKHLIEEREAELKEKLGLRNYLIRPIQRLSKFELLLLNMYKCTEKEMNPSPRLKEALEMIKTISRNGNTLTALGSITCKNSKTKLSIEETGQFLFRDYFKVHNRKWDTTVAFMFQNRIIFTNEDVKNKEYFYYKSKIDLKSLRINMFPEDPCDFILENYDLKKSIRLTAENDRIKTKWVDKIREILWGQLEQVKAQLKSKYQVEQ